ncbi:uncharacterized protein FA14DRAFT_157965 [Meira miltonrushii]|uniref:Secreted protein n=1 Tax=Meira miltonrushii TaxID=1280837 RepID=A0A316V3K4_9BASI|nr:uncharacterized protein FA14DRAFT_157965 [Meira miltonrushii]PWN32032.1 hypothetical protein FA14DRAFT_157965 [Meira miltonrushii]
MKALSLIMIVYAYQMLIHLVTCTDAPSQHDKHVIKEEPHSPATSRQSSPRRVWEDKHVIAEHVSAPISSSQTQRSPSSSPTRVASVHSHGTQHQAGQNIQQSAIIQTAHGASNVQVSQTEPQLTPSSPQTSHGSPVHQDIRQRLRSSRRPRSPQDNDASRIDREVETSQKTRHKRAHRRRLF